MLTLRVLTEAGLAFEEPAVSVVAPGERGYLGILFRHAPLVTVLKPGKLTWRRPDGRKEARTIGDGLLEVAKNRVTILTSMVSHDLHDRSQRSNSISEIGRKGT